MDILGVGAIVTCGAMILDGNGGEILNFAQTALKSFTDLIGGLFHRESEQEQQSKVVSDKENDRLSNTGGISANETLNDANVLSNDGSAGQKINEKSSVQVLKNNDLLEGHRTDEFRGMMSDFGKHDNNLIHNIMNMGISLFTNYDYEKNEYAHEMANYMTTVGGLRAMDGDTVLNPEDTRRLIEGELTPIANGAKSTSDFIEKSVMELERRVNNEEYRELMDAAPKNMAIYDVMKEQYIPESSELHAPHGEGLAYRKHYLNQLTDKFMEAGPRFEAGNDISEKDMRDKIYKIVDESLNDSIGNGNEKRSNMIFNISQQMDKAGIELSTSDQYRDVSISDRKVRTKDMMMAESDGKIDSVEQALYKTNGFKEKDVGKSEKPVEQNVGFTRF